ncbi:unnamed protein product [Dibothriocephalus latus]|uniref:Tektin n=1 Tax=Dibothriocephalus latus TaxID=60516 RepID=A0A3P7PE02_DIBLA|nr:unnamed protein product [Dibothriocephalus latus]
MAWSDKHEADMLDTEGGHLKPTSTNKQHYPGEARAYPQAAQSTVESWTQHPHDIILRAEHERMASEQLLHLACNIINDVTRDVIHQKDIDLSRPKTPSSDGKPNPEFLNYGPKRKTSSSSLPNLNLTL